jgi:hypothetical protein
MKKIKLTKLNSIVLTAVVIFAAGILTAIFTLSSIPQKQLLLKQKIQTLKELYELRRVYSKQNAAVAKAAKTYNPDIKQLSEISQQYITNSTPEIQVIENKDLVHGWQLQKTSIEYDKLPLKNLYRFLYAANNQTPPWKLENCQITAMAGESGNVRLTMIFTGLQKVQE